MKPDLKAFDELRVGSARLTRDSATATYRFARKDGRNHEVPLHYKFDTPVLRDADEARVQAARALLATAAINYGLFADRIVLDAPMTDGDLAWFRAMMDVTAREQYLTRFVRETPHPLILPEYHVAPDEFEPDAVRDLAEVIAPAAEQPHTAPSPEGERYAVLSSGGKESLLTYGVLKELGKEVFPVYVNESGRHWHTALLAHRHHVATEPNTRRVWTSVDRLYTAANRLLPCVRPDWQRVAADVYPTQLFTFHSYQMATMLVCLAERVGTMVMGNEFDEGPWPEVSGVRHYHGIYDQSQEFDLLATERYAKAGWPVRQSSIVRSASSLVIQDLLARRYPALAAVQTSCHATHLDEAQVVRPCGRCSKCLGVLLFLLAGGHDPKGLRYSERDIERLPARLTDTRIKVDPAEAEHALYLATSRGLAFESSANGFIPRAHPEVEALRYHHEMSRRDNLPPVLAREVRGVLSARATGELEWDGAAWVPPAT